MLRLRTLDQRIHFMVCLEASAWKVGLLSKRKTPVYACGLPSGAMGLKQGIVLRIPRTIYNSIG